MGTRSHRTHPAATQSEALFPVVTDSDGAAPKRPAWSIEPAGLEAPRDH
ncbi:hypothetical protein [Streptacidiphilus sp. MAP5-3]